jgi:hypothetical protein
MGHHSAVVDLPERPGYWCDRGTRCLVLPILRIPLSPIELVMAAGITLMAMTGAGFSAAGRVAFLKATDELRYE